MYLIDSSQVVLAGDGLLESGDFPIKSADTDLSVGIRPNLAWIYLAQELWKLLISVLNQKFHLKSSQNKLE